MIYRLITILLFVLSSLSQAVTIDDLYQNGQLSIRYNIVDRDNISVYQPVTMEIEVSTDRWFASGSRVGRFEIDNAIVYRSSQTSTNSSTTVAGKTRALQLWTLVFYPQKDGQLIIPELSVFVSLNTEGNIVVEGHITLPAKTLTINIPQPMKDIDLWLAAQELTISESYEGLKDNYKPGDAITRTITMLIEGSPAMMLPDIQFPDINGLALYRVPAKVNESSNRGELIGSRVQQFIYTVEQQGEYELPGYTYYWWNLSTQQQEIINLSPLAINTAAITNSMAKDVNSSVSKAFSWQHLLAFLLIASIVALIILLVARRGLKESLRQQKKTKQYDKHFMDAIQQQHALLALQSLYQLINQRPHYHGIVTLDEVFAGNKDCLKLLHKLKRHACGAGEAELLTLAEAKQLLAVIDARQQYRWPWQQPVVLSLNH